MDWEQINLHKNKNNLHIFNNLQKRHKLKQLQRFLLADLTTEVRVQELHHPENACLNIVILGK